MKKSNGICLTFGLRSQLKKFLKDRGICYNLKVFSCLKCLIFPSSAYFNYELHSPAKVESSARYIFDGRIEQPIKPCQQKPWQGLVSQVDRVLLPSRDCQNADHTSKNCNCGCRNPTHTSESCTCGSNYKIPIIYNSRYDIETGDPKHSASFTSDSINFSKKIKREAKPEEKSKTKRNEKKISKLKSKSKLSLKDFKSIRNLESIQKQKSNSKKSKKSILRQTRSKRKPDSPCGYTFESCDPKKHNREGCPLCYNCKCEPVSKARENVKFSPYDIKVPYKFVTHDEAPGSAPLNEEFEYEPAPYTGLKDQEMYRKYIQQIVSKYPEHMSRKMPDIQEQQRDLLKFVDELAKSNKSPGKKIDNEDIRYKMMDDAMGMYKYYEKAIGLLPKSPLDLKDGKFFKKRGTVLEVIELDPNDFTDNSFKIGETIGENFSESQ